MLCQNCAFCIGMFPKKMNLLPISYLVNLFKSTQSQVVTYWRHAPQRLIHTYIRCEIISETFVFAPVLKRLPFCQDNLSTWWVWHTEMLTEQHDDWNMCHVKRAFKNVQFYQTTGCHRFHELIWILHVLVLLLWQHTLYFWVLNC